MKPTPEGWPRISSSLFYDDAAAAIDWICKAFGFEVRMKIEGDVGRIMHSELTYGDGLIMVRDAGVKSGGAEPASKQEPKIIGRCEYSDIVHLCRRRRRSLRARAFGWSEDYRRADHA